MIDRAGGLDDVSAIEHLQRAALVGDQAGDRALAARARVALIDRSYGSDLVLERMAALSWLLHAGPAEERDSFRTLWFYKWVLDAMPGMAEVPLDAVGALIDDLGARYERAGMGDAAAAQLRFVMAIETGRADKAEYLFRDWRDRGSGSGSDCKACRRNLMVRYRLRLGDLGGAMREAEPLLSKSMTCASVPMTTCGQLTMPLLMAGHEEEAESLHKMGMKLLRSHDGQWFAVAEHAQYMALRGRWSPALKLIETRLGPALACRDSSVALATGLAIWLACEAARARRRRVVSVRFPRAVPGQPRDGVWEVDALRAMGERLALDRARRLDRRNGTSMWSDHVAKVTAFQAALLG